MPRQSVDSTLPPKEYAEAVTKMYVESLAEELSAQPHWTQPTVASHFLFGMGEGLVRTRVTIDLVVRSDSPLYPQRDDGLR